MGKGQGKEGQDSDSTSSDGDDEILVEEGSEEVCEETQSGKEEEEESGDTREDAEIGDVDDDVDGELLRQRLEEASRNSKWRQEERGFFFGGDDSDQEPDAPDNEGEEGEDASHMDGGQADEDLLLKQICDWTTNDGQTLVGRPLTCLVCGGKKLLLNNTMLQQHLQSKIHKKKSNGVEETTENLCQIFVFSEMFSKFMKDSGEEMETHQERLERMKCVMDQKEQEYEKRSGKTSKRKQNYKKRPGKRQREAMRLKKSTE